MAPRLWFLACVVVVVTHRCCVRVAVQVVAGEKEWETEQRPQNKRPGPRGRMAAKLQINL